LPTPKILAGIDESYERLQEDQARIERLAVHGHAPDVLLIGCSDARIPMALIARLDPGAVFVTRNVANVVPPYGTSQMGTAAAIEYAVVQLRVPHIVIVGHTDCGGIRALEKAPDWDRMPHVARWIEHARPAKTKIDASGLLEEDRHLATVRENVLLQLENLRSYDAVREGEKAEALNLHGWVYRLETGVLETCEPETNRWKPLVSAR
jgi:carbonic anhydrase